MFENFSQIDFIILGASVLLNVIFIISLSFLFLKNKKDKESVLEKIEEIKVTKVNETDDVNAFEEIIEAMQKDIESEKENAVELFEQEQEEKAIISYQELLNAKNKNELKVEKDATLEKIKFSEIEEKIELEKTKAEPKLVTTPQTKFTNSEFVSPVFGKMDRNPVNNAQIKGEIPEEKAEDFENHDLERTLNIEPLTDEIKKNNEFLMALKEFRKNL